MPQRAAAHALRAATPRSGVTPLLGVWGVVQGAVGRMRGEDAPHSAP